MISCVHKSVQATLDPYLCPPGTYNPNPGGANNDECIITPAGTYVALPGAGKPEGLCSIGHYCPEGSTTGDQEICPAGRTFLPNKASAFCWSCAVKLTPHGFHGIRYLHRCERNQI